MPIKQQPSNINSLTSSFPVLCLLLTVPVCNALYSERSEYETLFRVPFHSAAEMRWLLWFGYECVFVCVCVFVAITEAFTSSVFSKLSSIPSTFPFPLSSLFFAFYFGLVGFTMNWTSWLLRQSHPKSIHDTSCHCLIPFHGLPFDVSINVVPVPLSSLVVFFVVVVVWEQCSVLKQFNFGFISLQFYRCVTLPSLSVVGSRSADHLHSPPI